MLNANYFVAPIINFTRSFTDLVEKKKKKKKKKNAHNCCYKPISSKSSNMRICDWCTCLYVIFPRLQYSDLEENGWKVK